MKKAIAAVAAVAALAFAQGAFAANTGSISVSHTPMVLAGSQSTTLHIVLPQSDDPIAAINIFTPSGYTLNTTQAAGTKIGTVDATALSHTANLTLPLSGDVVTANPASFTTQSTQCAGRPTSRAVWILNLSVAGQSIQLPVYINDTAGAEQALGAEKITVCLPPWDIPESLGGAAQGAQVLDVRFTVNGIFTTPVGGGLLKWDALFTPYTPKTGKANPAGTFEARAFVPLPIILGLHKSYVFRTNTWQLNGKVTEGGLPVPGLTVHIARGLSLKRLTQQSSTKTDTNGNWKTAGHLKPQRTTYFQLSASMPEHDYAAGCTSPATAVAPAGCVSAKLSPWSSKSAPLVIKVVPQPKKKHK
jgi:hypothetical protein